MSEQRRLSELDGLRGLAALAVCIFHFDLFKFGVTGVDLFFMISGFVIYMSITNAKSIGDFWFARFIRLYPAYWLSLIVAIISFKLFTNQPVEHDRNFVLGNITMLQPVFRSKNLVQVYWTLYVELNFYILISFLWGFKQLKRVELIAFIIMVITASIIIPYQLLDNSSPTYTRFFVVFRGLIPLISHFQLFAAGIIFYLIYTRGINYYRILLLIFSFALVALTHHVGGRVFYFLRLNEHLVCCFIYYLVFFLVIYNKASILKLPFLVQLGNISFILYLIHQSLGQSLSDYLTPSIGIALAKATGISASLILSWLITYYYDVPLRNLLKNTFKLKMKPSVASSRS